MLDNQEFFEPGKPLDHAWIASHIPHQGDMCLLDQVQAWDAANIRCTAISHRSANNPLRANQQLGIANGIEYAAQAMAVHGALTAPKNQPKPKVGYLVSVRGVNMHVARLDDIQADLFIDATCIMANENNMLYEFKVSAGEKILLEGRAAVVLDADALIANH
ncbi:3-hydroxylacyl-ACP dehydratase [Methylophilus sp. Leaf414]|uniref:3-hydroxylacyl-ACP dehydratase n=1 Tax=Methylophilus sp. Leaf414 TaxID=1736371 RepID=UPI000A65E3E6